MNKHEVNEDALTNIMILLQEAAKRGHLDGHLEYLNTARWRIESLEKVHLDQFHDFQQIHYFKSN